MFCTAQGILQDYKNFELPAGFCLEDNCVVERYILYAPIFLELSEVIIWNL